MPVTDNERQEAIAKYNIYAQKARENFQAPQANISIYEGDDETIKVYMDVEYNNNRYNLESIETKHVDDFFTYLNDDPMVREKFANGRTVSLEDTRSRVETFVKRFQDKQDSLYLYSGFVVTDAEDNTFLGAVNLGGSGTPGIAEMARLNRTSAWSHIPAVVTEYSDMLKSKPSKQYSGLGTAETCTLFQYAAGLKRKGFNVSGVPLSAIVSTARLDNEGSWKSNAKAGMEVYDVVDHPQYPQYPRYQLRINI